MGDVICRRLIDILRKYNLEKVFIGVVVVVVKWCKDFCCKNLNLMYMILMIKGRIMLYKKV